ncbi:MAG: RecG-like helicase [Candidatus Tokpelaia sp. JSC085]|nr:MAG: RecG-like helicase [Candidatus Tokpelaia sp. JSC085]
MRPSVLDSMFVSIRSLPGLGSKVFRLLTRTLKIDLAQDDPCIVDLLHFLPYSVIDRRNNPGVSGAAAGSTVTLLSLIIISLRLSIERTSPIGSLPMITRARSYWYFSIRDITG